MSQHIALEDLSAHLDRALPRWRAEQVQAHLEHCVECRSSLAELQRAVRYVRAMPLTQLPPEASARLAAAMEPAPDVRRRPMPVPRLALAAGVVLALSGALSLVGSVRWAPRAFDAGRGSSAVGAPPDVTRGRSRTASGAGPGDEAGPSADARNAVGAEDFTGAELVVPATPDSRSAGHPRPFATARQEDYDRVGGVPPPELAVAPAPGAVEAGNAGPGADLADSGPGPDGAADAAVPVRAGTASAAPPTAAKEPDAQSARARPEGGMGEQAAAQATRIPQIAPLESPGEDRDLRWMVAAAAALLLLSAALFVRASSR